jgi:F-type H+-transporting ATPase subunit epsilon
MSGKLNCTIVTPEATVLSREAEFVALPLADGEIGIAANHSPLIGRLGYGEMRLRSDSAVVRYYVDGGFVQVADNKITLLTGQAFPAEKVNAAAAQAQLDAALKRAATTPEALAIRDRLLAQARAQLRVARRTNPR